MARPNNKKVSIRIKLERADIGRAQQKKITRELRSEYNDGKGPSLSEMFFRTSTFTSIMVRTVASIRVAGSLRKRRALLARAPMTSAVIKDPNGLNNVPALPTGNRKTKYRKKHKIDIRNIDYMAVLGELPEPSGDFVNLWQQSFKTHCDCGASQRGVTFAGLHCELCGESLWDSMDAPFLSGIVANSARPWLNAFTRTHDNLGALEFDVPTGSFDDTEIGKIVNDTNGDAPSELERSLHHRKELIEKLDRDMKAARERHLQHPRGVGHLDSALFSAPILKGYFNSIEELHDKLSKEDPGYGVAINLAMMATPEASEEGTFINQRQADTVSEVKKTLEAKSPLAITRGHYGDLQAAAAYPGCQKIFDDLTKNGVEFIEPDDPRAKLADYSVCFMYPNVIEAFDVSKYTTQKEVENLTDLENAIQQISPTAREHLKSIKHLDKAAFNADLPEALSETTPLANKTAHQTLTDACRAMEPFNKEKKDKDGE